MRKLFATAIVLAGVGVAVAAPSAAFASTASGVHYSSNLSTTVTGANQSVTLSQYFHYFG